MSKAVAAGFAVLCALVLCGPAVAGAATISGTVSDENTHAGIGGIEVCANPVPYEFETECQETDAGGHYSVTELRPANYRLHFSSARNNLRYMSEYWNDKLFYEEADLIAIGSPEESRQIDAELAEGGSIAGTVIDDVTKGPIEGLAACATSHGGMFQRCDKSDAAGHYEIVGLPSGEYDVEYEGWNQVNYIRELYKDAESLAQSTEVSVTAPLTTSGIDDELARGAEVLGHVSEVSSGAPVEDAMVCAPLASAPTGNFNTNCASTDASGNYAIRGLPAGSYVIGFDVGFNGPFGTGPTVTEWWKGVSTRAEATVLELTTPSTTTGIDGKASRPYLGPSAPESEPAPLIAPLPPQSSVSHSLPKCKKGFHRKLVKGKRRCVRKHRRHRHHKHRHHA